MLNYIILSMFSMISSAYSSETHIDFESVDVSANSVGPSLQAIVERKTQTEFDPYKFEELCSESNEVIKKKNDISLRLIEGSGLLHEEPLLQPGKYRTCIMNNLKGDIIHTNYRWIVKSDKKNGMRVYDEPSERIYDCEKGKVRIDPFGRSYVNNYSGHCEEKSVGKMQDMFFEGLTSFNVTLLYPDLFELDNNIERNLRKFKVGSRYCGSNKEHCRYELPKLTVVRLKRIKDDKIVYIGFDKESVTIERKHLIFYMNEQSWLFYMEKIDE